MMVDGQVGAINVRTAATANSVAWCLQMRPAARVDGAFNGVDDAGSVRGEDGQARTKRERVGVVQRGESSGWVRLLSGSAGHGEAKSHRRASGLGHGLLPGASGTA